MDERMLQARGVLLDLDGTLMAGGQALPGAAAALRRLGARCAIVSNDAEHTPAELAAKLRAAGLAMEESRILLAGALAVDSLSRERPGCRVLMLTSPSLIGHARAQGLRPASGEADAVILGRDRTFTYEKLQAAARAVRGGALLVVCNPDLTHPGPGGAVVPETGALLAALLACTGAVPYRVVGKPEPALFLAGMARLGSTAASTVMFGDNPATDGVGARRLGITFIEALPHKLAEAA
ncbi:HAD-IIA family hydrolase [Teichococcus deserti]|nr:HAD-IIA family hydrolase [Pseudoroseomonas deserti]